MRSLGAEAADSVELRSSVRHTERAGTRREPCMLNDRISAKVGFEPEGIGTDPDVRAVRAGSTAGEWTDPRMQGQETLAGHGIVVARAGSTPMDQTMSVMGACSPARVEGWITCRLHCQQRTATEGCHDPERILSNPESRMTRTNRDVYTNSFLLSDHILVISVQC